MERRHWQRVAPLLLMGVLALVPPRAHATDGSFLGGLGAPQTVATTVPVNGDINPYGVAVVRRSVGNLVQGDVLVSNFNNVSNAQGTGTTIVQIAPSGAQTLFAQISANSLPGPCPGGVGLTTALAVVTSGWVIVGSLPTSDGTSATMQAGCLLVLNSQGQVVETIAGPLINGPWDMTSLDLGNVAVLFVTNVLNSTVAASPNVVNGGTVVRLVLTSPSTGLPAVLQETVIGSGFPERTDPNALVVGPTGLGITSESSRRPPGFSAGAITSTDDRGRFENTLYVADSQGNRIAAIPNALLRRTTAGSGVTVSAGGALNDPLGLAIAPNGDILTANGADGYLVETTPAGAQVATKLVDSSGSPPGSGALFGLAVAPGHGLYFVDDATNELDVLP